MQTKSAVSPPSLMDSYVHLHGYSMYTNITTATPTMGFPVPAVAGGREFHPRVGNYGVHCMTHQLQSSHAIPWHVYICHTYTLVGTTVSIDSHRNSTNCTCSLCCWCCCYCYCCCCCVSRDVVVVDNIAFLLVCFVLPWILEPY